LAIGNLLRREHDVDVRVDWASPGCSAVHA
jgi:hypothetical protein